jgi:exopolysaccharide biosynthesis polyprenyl glycosylphosphotransferase
MERYYVLINAVIVMFHIMYAFFNECYSGILRRGSLVELKSVVIHNACILAGTLILAFFMKISVTYSRAVIGYFFLVDTVLMLFCRCMWKKLLYHRNKKVDRLDQMLLVTTSNNAPGLLEKLNSYEYGGFWIKGLILTDQPATVTAQTAIEEIPVVATIDTMYEYILTNVIDDVIIDGTIENTESMVQSLLEMGVSAHITMDMLVQGFPNPTLESLNACSVITTRVNQMSFQQKVLKRLLDIVAGLLGTLVTGVLFIILAPIIYIQSPGPIFFKQTRMGKNGRRFKMYKFRSMYMDAEERKKELAEQNKMSGLMFKVDNDPRITPIGRFIRKTSLDEFPQFINILKGDMSLVGTRPPTEDEYEQYELRHKSRLAIKPGLTGMWQASGRSDITDFEEVVRLDNEYIKNFSLRLDIKIIWKTVAVVLLRKGSE